MKKRILALLLVLCLSSILAACGGSEDADTNTQQSTQSSQTGKVQKPANHSETAPPTKEELSNAKG